MSGCGSRWLGGVVCHYSLHVVLICVRVVFYCFVDWRWVFGGFRSWAHYWTHFCIVLFLFDYFWVFLFSIFVIWLFNNKQILKIKFICHLFIIIYIPTIDSYCQCKNIIFASYRSLSIISSKFNYYLQINHGYFFT